MPKNQLGREEANRCQLSLSLAPERTSPLVSEEEGLQLRNPKLRRSRFPGQELCLTTLARASSWGR